MTQLSISKSNRTYTKQLRQGEIFFAAEEIFDEGNPLHRQKKLSEFPIAAV
ncbi:MAG: hypothetical protein KGM99_14590 [Burkholderiales bacterium]|nr:hypothetical protein [Burkholderiales bacterium]